MSLEKIRRDAGWSLDRVAARTGVHRAIVESFERGYLIDPRSRRILEAMYAELEGYRIRTAVAGGNGTRTLIAAPRRNDR